MNDIKNLKKAGDRIKKAIKNKEKIILYGDGDLDGMSSAIILEEVIRNLGGEVAAFYFPDREFDGYGISVRGLAHLENFSPALLVSLDCGIGNFEQVLAAKKMGFKVIIIDHHEILEKLPKAEIVVDPKQKGDKSFKGFSNTGIVFRLAEEMLGKLMTENLRKNFLELTALATIADMMPRESENEILITEGLRYIEDSWRPGLKALFDNPLIDGLKTTGQKISKIISILNVRDTKNNMPSAFLLLRNRSMEDSKEIIRKLLEKSEERRDKIRKLTEEAESAIVEKDLIIFTGSKNFEVELNGPVASIVCQKYNKPAFIYKRLEKESIGAVRTPSGVDSVAMMKKCKKMLITYGGHPMASGFRLINENLEEFKACLSENYSLVKNGKKKR
jgi:single-stranded-DNA-specific exonuclease